MSILGQFQFRRDVAANWTSVNPILLDGELGIESDTDQFKIGDGVTPWNGLPYGGIQGAPGTASQTIVGATTVVNPNVNPSVTDADPGANADLRFNLPRAREVIAETTNTVSPGTNASVSQTADVEGDVLLTFNIPRGAAGWSPILANVTDGERRVLRLVDWTGGEGTKPAVPTDNYIGAAGFTNLAGATDIRGEVGATGPAANAFTNIAVTGQNTVVADQANDTLTLVAGTNISLVTNDITDSIVINSTSVATNGFGVVAGNTGTASADTPTDTLAITGGTGISTAATDTPDGLVITNTDTGSSAVSAHEAAADPHPQYLTQTEADALYQAAGQSAGPQFVSSIHSATQANNTTTPQDLTGMVFTLPPGKTIRIQGNLIFTAAATTTGAFYGFRVAHGAGANGNVQGSWNAEVALTSAAAATGIADGDSVNVAGGATAASGILGTASVAGNNSAWIMLTLVNRSTNVNATVALQFRTEVANSAVTAQIGTSAVAIIG